MSECGTNRLMDPDPLEETFRQFSRNLRAKLDKDAEECGVEPHELQRIIDGMSFEVIATRIPYSER